MNQNSLSTVNLFETYKRFCYIFGQKYDRNPSRDITKLIYQADLEMTPGMFTSLWFVTTALAGVMMLIVSFIIFVLPAEPVQIADSGSIHSPLSRSSGRERQASGFPSISRTRSRTRNGTSTSRSPTHLRSCPSSQVRERPRWISSAVISREEYGQISNEFRKVLFRVDILGEDVVTAMNGLTQNTPSDLFRDICIDMTNIIYGGGGLKSYLETKSKELMAIRRQTYKEFVESLAVFGEGYLGGVVMMITLAVLGIVISGALGIEFGPLKPVGHVQCPDLRPDPDH